MKRANKLAPTTLGTLGDSPQDGSDGLSAVTTTPPVAIPKKRTAESPELEQLELPRGAVAIMRLSGGLRFASREVVVFADGATKQRDANQRDAAMTRGKRLSAAQLKSLNKAIAAAVSAKMLLAAAEQRPDRFAYEIVVRSGRKKKRLDLADGTISAELSPLVAQLKALVV